MVFAGVGAKAPVRVSLRQGTPARPYVDMTIQLHRRFGGRSEWEGDTLVVSPGKLHAADLEIEPDASAASYLWALPAIWGGRMTVPDLGRSEQGDAGFPERVLGPMGAEVARLAASVSVRGGQPLRGIDVDLGDMPDVTLTAAVVALFARGPTRIRGVSVLRHHESDRLAAGGKELRKLGAEVTEHDDGLTISPPVSGPRGGVAIDTYDDHRMAMAFAMVGDVEIRDPGCVAKTYPEYFQVLANLGMVKRR
jgi:3-phosphoshikimate 1-carboxyvinyltransferase